MQLPILAPAPLVSQHAEAFKDLFENQKQYRHFQNYLTGLIVLPNKSMANISRCILDSADKTNLSRFMSESPWFQEQVNQRRLTYLHQETKRVRKPKSESVLVIDDSLCEHVGSLFDAEGVLIGITTTATIAIRLRTIQSPAIMSVAPFDFQSTCVCIGVMKRSRTGKRLC